MEEFETKDEKIMYLLGETLTEVRGVNKRLDTLNGKVGRHDADISDLKLTRATIQGEEKVTGGVRAWIGSIGGGVLVYMILSYLGLKK